MPERLGTFTSRFSLLSFFFRHLLLPLFFLFLAPFVLFFPIREMEAFMIPASSLHTSNWLKAVLRRGGGGVFGAAVTVAAPPQPLISLMCYGSRDNPECGGPKIRISLFASRAWIPHKNVREQLFENINIRPISSLSSLSMGSWSH